MLEKWKWNPYQIAILAILVGAILASYYLPSDAREELRADAGYVWGALATIFGPLVRRRLAESR